MKNRIALVLLGLVLVLGGHLSRPTRARADSPPVNVAKVFDLGVSSNASILSSSLTPGSSQDYVSVAYRVTIALFGTNSVVDVRIANADGTATARSFSLNGGTALSASCLYTFTIGASRECTYNFRCQTGTTIGYLLVEEIRDGSL